jgi:hypothetical protein
MIDRLSHRSGCRRHPSLTTILKMPAPVVPHRTTEAERRAGMGERIPTANEMYFSELTADATQMEWLEKQFFQSVGLPNGTWKTTTYRRLDNLNELVQKFLPTDRPLDVMDVAVSSGVSTVEWIESMERAGAQCRMTAGDATADAYLVSILPGMRVLVDRHGHALQYEVAGRGIKHPVRKLLMPVYLWPVLFIHLVLGMVVAPALRAATHLEEGARLGTHWRPLKLVSPTLRNRNRIDVVEDDILVNRSYQGCFHAVRAANILNRGYFKDSTLTAMLTNLRNRLKTGGLLIVCRTNPQTVNHGTIFELGEDGRLHVLARLNDGSEVEHLALALPPRHGSRASCT